MNPPLRIAPGVPRWLLSCLPALLAISCSSVEEYYVVDDFDAAPADWVQLLDGGEEPARGLRVANGRLRVEGMQILSKDLLVRPGFRGFVEFSLVDAERDGYGGVFLEEINNTDTTRPGHEIITRTSLAVNSSGEWSGFDGNPLRPIGMPTWKPVAEGRWLGPLRVEIGTRGDTVTMRLVGADGVVHSFPLTAVTGPTHTVDYRVGVFAANVDLDVDHFVLGEDSEAGPFRPEKYAAVSTTDTAAALLRLAERRAAEFGRSPRRGLLLGVVDAVYAAERAARSAGDAPDVAATWARGEQILKGARSAASEAGAEGTLSLALEGFHGGDVDASPDLERARAAEEEGRPTEALIFHVLASRAGNRPLAAEARALASRLLEPLTFQFEYDVRAGVPASQRDRLRQRLGAAARESYGAIPRRQRAELELSLVVEEADFQHDRTRTDRHFYRDASERPVSRQLDREIERLEGRFREDLQDARTRVDVMRAGELTPHLETLVRKYSFPDLDVRGVELAIVDGQQLEDLYRQIVEHREQLEEQRKLGPVEESVPAELAVDYVRVVVAFRLKFGGKVVVEDRTRASEGIEQWVHPAFPEKNLRAARYDESRKERLYRSTVARVASRVRTATSLDSLFAQLGADEATRFLIRMARATGSDEDRDRLEWRLQNRYGLRGLRLDWATRGLLEL